LQPADADAAGKPRHRRWLCGAVRKAGEVAFSELHQLHVGNLAGCRDDEVAGAILFLTPVVQVRGRYPPDARLVAEDRTAEWLGREGRGPPHGTEHCRTRGGL